MRLIGLLVGAALLLGACSDVPLGRIQDNNMDPGGPKPSSPRDIRK